MSIQEVAPGSLLLALVKQLGGSNTATLGFLPEGAFDQYTQQGQILAETDEAGNLEGYVIYRVAGRRASIVHLCSSESARRKGVARGLIQEVVRRTTHLVGILARCRRDFPADKVWPRLGFYVRREIPGRGRMLTALNEWWLPHPHPTLFSEAIAASSETTPVDVAIDMNVFFDLCYERQGAEESRALQADWLASEIRLCVTGELFNEISRIENMAERAERRRFAGEYYVLSGSQASFESALDTLRQILGNPRTSQEESDLRQLAHTAASGSQFFVTRDEDLLKVSSQIEEHLKIAVLRPSTLIVQLDSLRNQASYQPSRIRSSQVEARRLLRDDIKFISDAFFEPGTGETKGQFNRHLTTLVSHVQSVEGTVVRYEGNPIAFFVIDRRHPLILRLPLIRAKGSPLAPTIARYVLTHAIETSVRLDYHMTVIDDTHCGSIIEAALAESAFLKRESVWVKINMTTVATPEQTAVHLKRLSQNQELADVAGSLIDTLANGCTNANTAQQASDLEEHLWPGKITDLGIPSFVVSIRPQWAQHLFDEDLAKRTLFGAQTHLMLN